MKNSGAQMGSFWDDFWNKTQDELTNQIPGKLVDELGNQLFPGGGGPGNQTVTVQQPGATQYIQMPGGMSVPPAVLYGALGLMGVGVLLVLVKALK